MKKNDIAEVRIEDIGIHGEGIGKVNGYTLFIKDTVIGDIVEAKVMKAKKQYGYAKMLRIIKCSPDRVEAKCRVARQCGGCQIQELSYEKQLQFKQEKVRNHLERIGKFAIEDLKRIEEPIVGMEYPFAYRNKAQFPIGRDATGKAVAGFYAEHTHQIIPNTDCALGVSINQSILECILKFADQYQISVYDEGNHVGLLRHVMIRYGFWTKEIMVCLIVNGEKLPYAEELVQRLQQFEGMTSITLSINTKKSNVIMGDKIITLWGQAYITDKLGGTSYQISPLSFYQVNPLQTEKLYQLAMDYADLQGEEIVWDLYCGIGTISLFLASKAKKVYGVEVIPQAIENAKENARINQIENAIFYVGKAEEVLPQMYQEQQIRADVIVVDPPRKGCDESLLETIVQMRPKKVVYVSCDSATLARDLRYLCDRGYGLERFRAVDCFGQTVHCESVVLLSHKSPDSHISVTIEFGKEKGQVPLGDIVKRAEEYKTKK